MNIENSSINDENETVRILKLVEKRINELSDEKVVYSSERYYFGAGGIKGKRIGFTFTYSKKTNELGFQAESAHITGTSLLKKIFEEKIKLIEEEVGLSFTLDKGIKNEHWYRIISKIFIDEDGDIIEQIDSFIRCFIKFRDIMIILANSNEFESNQIYNSNEQSNSYVDYVPSIDIGEKEWINLILDRSIFSIKDINIILLIYVMGGKATAKELSLIENTHPSSYNSWVIALSKRILTKAKIEPPKKENGQNVYWCIPFKGQELSDNSFQWILRENLYDALEHLINEGNLDISEVEGKYERGKVKLKKVKSDSWVDDLNISDSNFLGRKSTDYSSFNKGTTIPQRYHEKFLSCLSKNLSKGEQVKVKLILNENEYKGVVRWPASVGRKGVTIQLNYNEKALLEVLREKLSISYDYIIDYINQNDKKPNNIPEENQEYIDFYKGNEIDTFIMKLIPRNSGVEEENIEEDEVISEEEINIDEDDSKEFRRVNNIYEELVYIHRYISSKGFEYSEDLIQNLYISLKTKPFVILSGISGTGKSKIAELFADAIGATYKNGRFKLVPVKPDWSDSTDLLGYRNIEGKFTPGIITSVAYEAMKNPELPYFVCLDEMNLARVEYYFSDILSLMETRRVDEDGNIVSEKLLSKEQFGRDERAFDKFGDVYIPQNMYIVGTVNMDETTFPFSKKVLDRANTIEFNKVNLNYNFDDVIFEEVERRVYKNDFLVSKYLKLSQCKEEKALAIDVIDKLVDINKVLEEYNQHFGFRVRDEIVFYMIYAANVNDNIMDFDKAFDNCIVQKILPKINGSNGDVLEILIRIFNLLNETKYEYTSYIEEAEIKDMINKSKISKYNTSSEKIILMIRRFIRDGFTTFWQ